MPSLPGITLPRPRIVRDPIVRLNGESYRHGQGIEIRQSERSPWRSGTLFIDEENTTAYVVCNSNQNLNGGRPGHSVVSAPVGPGYHVLFYTTPERALAFRLLDFWSLGYAEYTNGSWFVNPSMGDFVSIRPYSANNAEFIATVEYIKEPNPSVIWRMHPYGAPDSFNGLIGKGRPIEVPSSRGTLRSL